MEEKEIPYADLEWAKENETGQTRTIIIDKHKFDIVSINDLDDQLLRDKCTTTDSTGIPDIDINEYKQQLLMKCVVKPKMSKQFVDFLRTNKKSGTYTKLINEVMAFSGTGLSLLEIEEEKN